MSELEEKIDAAIFSFFFFLFRPFYTSYHMLVIKRFRFGYWRLLMKFPKVFIEIRKDGAKNCTMRNHKMFGLILMQPNMSKLEFDTALLHEFGHRMDFTKNNRMKNTCSEKGSEKKAWKYAIELSDSFGIPMDYTMAQKWLGTYGTRSAFLTKRSESDKKT